ncbi:branched-chain amino acid ABC transporter permease [Actinoplanes sp. ATCC 53533]|uniref:branched-chain amino acid ABC transporter permease n=1 Tax=Actinoplanes sp. ATCC 53533 TaxID=1288362 RepID=UPI000F77DD72|nr:branched-chain amino acid ABC transporter permease [Actinoplanes sp. ATCC 53533]RSM56730.1 branched-chain amino acid ABC transporter permease [Actinoplanes sp. ATCC 53533]
MSQFVQLTVYGLANGAVLALAALGFVLIYKATSVINFAQGELLLVGAYLFYTAFVLLRLPLAVAVLGGVVAAAVLGVAIERLVLRPLIGEDPIAVIMVTIGLAAVLKAAVTMFYGTTPREMPKVLPAGTVTIAGATVPLDRIFAVAIAVVVLTAVTVFFRFSRHGIAMRAVADDQQAALAQGISVRRIFALAWAMAAVSALIAGILLADIAEVSQNLATFGLVVFPVVILGGLDSVPGTIVGGAVIGLLSQYAEGVSAGASQVVPYVALVLILLVRPYGLFGQPRIERV